MRVRLTGLDPGAMDPVAAFYSIRVNGHLGATVLSAFPEMTAQRRGGCTVLTGLLDRSALYGVLAEFEALGLELVEIRQLEPHQARSGSQHRDRRDTGLPEPR